MPNRAAVMTELNKIVVEERPEPSPGPREAVVQVQAVGVCGSDTAYFKVGRIGDYVVDGPIILGHEASGVVTEVGSDVVDVSVGDRVAIEPGTPCRDCRECMAGRYHLCPDLVFLATPPYDGALVERMAIDFRNLHLIPDEMSYEEAALLEPLSVGIWGCRRASLEPGDDVLVTGAGPVGLLAAATAWAFGAGSVTVTDVSEFRLDLARGMGFGTEHSEAPSERRFDVLLECSGAPGVLGQAMGRLRPHGRAAMIGMSKEEAIGLPLSQLNPQELTLSLVNRYNHTWPLAIALVSTGRVDVTPLITHHFGLDEAADALTLSSRVSDSVKAFVHPQR
ncbi:alcohol dehydrogenase catalytic domain-containing protein [Nocardioides terrisoli]|uniref:alcohol dehydrogenase catalytic domain-containing protein n=1 Tax=Nocardioides terrisoli TaxID=3388267 RepID=UPI00287B99A4|nr:alcohol dehydrogenase catalytic domain-containing protein [Nocardioides marmorisolisilvae]